MALAQQFETLELREAVIEIRKGKSVNEVARASGRPISSFKDIFLRSTGVTAGTVHRGAKISLILKRAVQVDLIGILTNPISLLKEHFRVQKETGLRDLFFDVGLETDGRLVKETAEEVHVLFLLEHLGPREDDFNLIVIRHDTWSHSRKGMVIPVKNLNPSFRRMLVKKNIYRVTPHSPEEAMLTASLNLI